jgi:hypothetical protein
MASPTARTGSSCPAVGNSVRITSHTRSITCGRNSGSGAPLRSSTQRVWAFTSPSRTGTYRLAGSIRAFSSAYPTADAMESVSGLRWPVT